jgi:hypothetical protein
MEMTFHSPRYFQAAPQNHFCHYKLLMLTISINRAQRDNSTGIFRILRRRAAVLLCYWRGAPCMIGAGATGVAAFKSIT